MAYWLRFSLLAITSRLVFDSIIAKSSASSSPVHRGPLGRGRSSFLLEEIAAHQDMGAGSTLFLKFVLIHWTSSYEPAARLFKQHPDYPLPKPLCRPPVNAFGDSDRRDQSRPYIF
jgi:hypothetical protein